MAAKIPVRGKRAESHGRGGEVLRLGRISGNAVGGGWTPWSSWSQCSRDCSRGVRSRKRACTNPEPKYGGQSCTGAAQEYQECNVTPCPESWSGWSDWSQCDVAGSQMRVRHCDVLFPTGNQCSGNATETRPCPPDSNFISGFTEEHPVHIDIRNNRTPSRHGRWWRSAVSGTTNK
ncbi:hypothetical protein CRUP_018554 [Coryphaenoides rupestris]|nr:hypothetical protein CRUP_018554 [Coryphaenoides rupestris]